MGSRLPPLAQLTQDGVDASVVVAVEAAQDAKRRKRDHTRPVLDPGVAAPCAEENLDASQPQPHASLDPNEYQERPYAPLAASLSCTLCQGLLREAMTAPECGHTYCYDCIEARVDIGGNHNVCPVAGCGAVLGPNPFDHHRIMYDTLLDTIVQKIFPRPELDAALTARRAEREEATRQARAEVNGACGRGQLHQQQHRGAAKQRISSTGVAGAGAGRGSGGRGGANSPDGGAEGDDEGSDPEPSRHGHEAAGAARRHHR